MKTKWPSELVHAIACRRCVLFFGAGVSMNALGKDGKSRTPSWSDFLSSATKSVGSPAKKIVRDIKALVAKADFLTAAEVIRNEVGTNKFKDLIKASFHSPDFQPARIHELLFLLDLRIAITPNFDSIYETAVLKHGAGAVTVKKFNDDDIADSLRRHERVLIKSHGSVASPSQLIFTRSDYASARNKHSDFYELIDALLRTHTFMFVGCGLDDPDIRALLENYRYRHPSGQNHYFVAAKNSQSKQIRDVLEDSLKINIVDYEYTADHRELTNGLESLVTRVETERVQIGRMQTW